MYRIVKCDYVNFDKILGKQNVYYKTKEGAINALNSIYRMLHKNSEECEFDKRLTKGDYIFMDSDNVLWDYNNECVYRIIEFVDKDNLIPQYIDSFIEWGEKYNFDWGDDELMDSFRTFIFAYADLGFNVDELSKNKNLVRLLADIVDCALLYIEYSGKDLYLKTDKEMFDMAFEELFRYMYKKEK